MSRFGVRAICFACVAIFRTRSRAENVAAVNQSSRYADFARVFRLEVRGKKFISPFLCLFCLGNVAYWSVIQARVE